MAERVITAVCLAVVSRNGDDFVLLKFEPRGNNFIGEVAKEIFEFEQGVTYSITIKKEGI